MVKISAGSYDLNHWLHGGYETDVVTVFYGGPGSGKTNFCMCAAASQARKENKVIYIDTEGGFSTERMKQLSGDQYEVAMQNILLLKPTDFHQQKSAFEELEKHLKDQVGMIIVDGMTILYRLDFASAREQDEKAIQVINAQLARQMKQLAEIARKRNIPVLVTNQVYKWEDTARMVGGDILQYWGKCLIELTHDRGKRTAILQKHRHLPESEFTFQIVDKGIRKRGWI